jgi:hypothetical protein
VQRLADFRSAIAGRIHDRINAIQAGTAGAPNQLTIVAGHVADRRSPRVGPDSSHRSILTRPSDEPTGIVSAA